VLHSAQKGKCSGWDGAPCRHGDFFTAVLKSQPQFINDFKGRLWSRFFCLSVYITMYLNDHQVGYGIHTSSCQCHKQAALGAQQGQDNSTEWASRHGYAADIGCCALLCSALPSTSPWA
jgi:hypothetical protein